MGDITEMVLEGILCEGCGVYLGGAVGYPRKCHSCGHSARPKLKHYKNKVQCPTCGRMVVGLSDHVRDKHSQTTTFPL